MSHVEYGDAKSGKKHTLDPHVVKPSNSVSGLVPKLNLDKNSLGKRIERKSDSRNLTSAGLKGALHQETIESISYQKRQKIVLRRALMAQDTNRSFTCSLSRFRNETNKINILLSEQDY